MGHKNKKKKGEIWILLRIPRVKYRVIKCGFGHQKVRQKVQKYKKYKQYNVHVLCQHWGGRGEGGRGYVQIAFVSSKP